MKIQDLSVQFNQTHSQATLWSISSIPPNLIAVCFDSNQLFSALLHRFPWTHIILPRLQLKLGILSKTACHHEHRIGGICGLSQLSPSHGKRGMHLMGPSRPRKDDNFKLQGFFQTTFATLYLYGHGFRGSSESRNARRDRENLVCKQSVV